jgi:glycosyltransferase involved in cell wall biosynthesis
MESCPQISVLLAVRNGERFLDAALASLAAQSYPHFEIILVDNGSRDGSAAIAEHWRRREPRLRLFRQERPGLARSLNYAASQARAPLFARLDADDIALSHRFEVQQARMADNPALGLLGSYVALTDSRGRTVGTLRHPTADADIRRGLRAGCTFVHSTIMMRRSAFERAGGYRDGLRITEDFDLWSRMAEVAEVSNVPEILVHYRLHRQSMSSRLGTRMALAAACVVAAREARRQGEAEPFREGRPCFRVAQALLNVPRQDFIRQLRVQHLRQHFDQLYLDFPLPPALKQALRSGAARLGVRPLYALCLQAMARLAASRTSARRRRQSG